MRAEMGGKKATEDSVAGNRQAPLPQGPARFGFTVTKKLGNAVTRNHIRRRLKEAVRHVAPEGARPDCDYVLIAREPAATLPFATLERDLAAALAALHAPPATTARRRGGTPRNNPTHGRAGRPDPASEG